MTRATIGGIAAFADQEVELCGWLYNRRSSGKLHFLQVRDGTGIIQCVVFKGEVSAGLFELCGSLPQESSITVTGSVRRDERSPIGYELGVREVRLVHEAGEYPISPKEHGVGFLMEHRHLYLRSTRPHAILKVRNEVVQACRDYMSDHGFMLIDAPILTPAACEGTTTLFETDYFGQSAFLTQSGQLYMEAAAMAFGKVYCFGPTFRAEKSKTRRHLTEFWMIEPEIAFCDLDQDMDVAEDMVAYIVARVLDHCGEELKALERDVSSLEKVCKPFPRITYDQAVGILAKKGSELTWGDDFGADEETLLSEEFDAPVLVHRYPAAVKAFYMKGDPEDERLALCVDMLAPEGFGEIIGGGQREDDLATLEGKIEEHGLPREAFEWYVDVRRYGSVPHAGFGMGLERVVGWLCGSRHVRETIPFPRTLQRLYP
ncbi:asparagine--tRNA ligase [Candidatus Latescibacterota bacterium]